MKHRIALAIAAAFAFTSCAALDGKEVTLAYQNENVMGHTASAAITLGGKAPKAVIALTKKNSTPLADSGSGK